MTTVAEHVSQAMSQLGVVSDTPRLDAEILLAHDLGMTRSQLLASLQHEKSLNQFPQYIERRIAYEPLAYILGEWEFYSLPFTVHAPVLVPRPETEHLVEIILENIDAGPQRIMEIGTGTGCIAVAIAKNAAHTSILATDLRQPNLELAESNARRHGVDTRIEFRHGSLFEVLQPSDSPFDAICSNPPYIEESAWDGLSPTIRNYEDRNALLAGAEGLDIIRAIVKGAPAHLRPGGLLALEVGMGQYRAVTALFQQNNYHEVETRNDLAGIERVVYGRSHV